jgi:hypothetical protein
MIREVWPSAASSTSARSTTPGTPSASSAFWEVVAVYRSFNDVRRTADWLDQPANAVESALRYYEAHRVEVDEWIGRNEEAADAAERVARARRDAS